MRLADLQQSFQKAILGEALTAPPIFASNARAAADERFGVYNAAYRLRLAEFVATDYPALRALLGDEDFGALVVDYIAATPSRGRNARWYGSRLPEFMRAQERWRQTEAVDLALFERALADAFDAADAPTIRLDDLTQVAPDRWPQLVFAFHPSLRLLTLQEAIDTLHAAMIADADAPARGPERSAVLIWRNDGEVLHRRAEASEAMALTEAMAGATFGQICQLLAFQAGEEVGGLAAGSLAQWLADGLIVEARDA